jgi:phage repressor protein C with HTH and peptisase S24 domain
MPDDKIPSDVGERLSLVRREFRMTQGELSEKLGINQNTLSQYEKGQRKVPDDIKQALADLFHVNIDWLVTGRGSMESLPEAASAEPEDEIVYLDILDVKASAGYGIENYEPGVKGRMPFAASALKPHNAKKTKIFEVSGDSMEPTLMNGDLVMFVENDTSGNGIFLLNRNGELFVKRLRQFPGLNRITVISDNSKFPTEEVDLMKENVHIIGKVISQIRWF